MGSILKLGDLIMRVNMRVANMRYSLALLLVASASSLLATRSFGQSVWNGSLSTSWTAAANWTPNGQPGSSATAEFNATGYPFAPAVLPAVESVGGLWDAA